jgi:sortase A
LLLLTGAACAIQGGWIQAKAALAQVLLHDAWSTTLTDAQPHRPWPWADFWPVARLRVEHLDVDLIVLAGDSGNVLAFGPGHSTRSAVPGGSGTVVISGHRDTHFRFLQDLRSGDRISLETARGEFSYRVQASATVDVRTARLQLSQAQRRLVLTTCYPFDALATGGPLRYVLEAVGSDDRPSGSKAAAASPPTDV